MLRISFITILIASLIITLLPSVGSAHHSRFYSHNRKMHVVTTNPAVAEIARQIGGDKVYVTSLLKADQNVKNPVIYRSMVQAVKESKVMIRLGKDIDPWIQSLIEKSGNIELLPGSAGYMDSSAGIPTSVNEGYWNDHAAQKVIAANIAKGFSAVLSKDASFFDKNLEKYYSRTDQESSNKKQAN